MYITYVVYISTFRVVSLCTVPGAAHLGLVLYCTTYLVVPFLAYPRLNFPIAESAMELERRYLRKYYILNCSSPHLLSPLSQSPPAPWPQSLDLCGPPLRDSSRVLGDAPMPRAWLLSPYEHFPLPLLVRNLPPPMRRKRVYLTILQCK